MKLLIIFGLVICSIIVCTAEDKCKHYTINAEGKKECFLCKARFAPVCAKNDNAVLKTFPNNCSMCVENCKENEGKFS